MTDYTSQINAWYEAIQYRTPPASELASFNAQLQAGIITTAQAIQQIEASSYTQSYVDPVIREYQAAFGRVPDQAGVAYWVGQVAANPANLAALSTSFANSSEFFSDYAATATTPSNSTLVSALYTNVLGRPADAAGLAYWSSQPLDAAQLLQAFAQSAEFITDTAAAIVAYQNLEVLGTEPTTGSLYAIPSAANTFTLTQALADSAPGSTTPLPTYYFLSNASTNFGSGLTVAQEQADLAHAQAVVAGAQNGSTQTLTVTYTLDDTLANLVANPTVVKGATTYAISSATGSLAINLGSNLTVAAEQADLANANAVLAGATNGAGLKVNATYTLDDSLANILANPTAVAGASAYTLTDAKLNLGSTAQTVAQVVAAETAAQAVINGALNHASLTLAPTYTVADTLADISGDPAIVAAGSGDVSYSLTDPAGSLGTITQAQAALVKGATDASQYTFTVGGYTLTTGQDTLTDNGAGIGSNVILGPLAGALGTQQPTLTNNDSLLFSGPNNLLHAWFNGSSTASGLNIQGVQTWIIENVATPTSIGQYLGIGSSSSSSSSTPTAATNPAVYLSGDAYIAGTPPAQESNIINGLMSLTYNVNSGTASLFVGNNAEPVYELDANGNPLSANDFSITVNNAVGLGFNGVDVDIAAGSFTGGETIKVHANVVGGFSEVNGSYMPPAFELIATNDEDWYNPNWTGFIENAYAITAGASAGPNGPVGFTNWVVSSTTGMGVGTTNILALGGEGSSSAQRLTLTDDGSNTVLFASGLSDSTSGDWANLKTIDLSLTTGNVVLTGAETDAQLGSLAFSQSSSELGIGGGLLTSDTSSLVTIKGGAGNSFYDLSSLTLADAGNASIDGGHNTKGNSEVAFNNSVVASVSAANPNGVNINISHIQVLDDTGYGSVGSNGSDSQGGTINLANFAGLQELNTGYDLIAGPLGNLLANSTEGLAAGTDIANDIAPKGYQLLQLLDADGSTPATLAQDLTLLNGFTNFAVNMMDVADGSWTSSPGTYLSDLSLTGYNITIVGESVVPTVNVLDTLKLWVSDDGVQFGGGTIFDAPVVTIDNYTTVDIYLPHESVSGAQNYVVLGSTQFVDQPVVSVPLLNGTAASLNFYDNTADTGGSPGTGPDNLVLGHTNFTANLGTSDIGITTVFLDATTPTTTIEDWGAGSFEIGATNASNLIATSTSHLIMDLPGTPFYVGTNGLGPVEGITVTGSATGQNLLQGTSGQVYFDLAGHTPPVAGEPGTGTLEVLTPDQIGNDILTGGLGAHGVTNVVGNSGDNFFPEGGQDIVNINPADINTSEPAGSTVWFAMYDVSNSGDVSSSNSGVGTVYEQAVTDINGQSPFTFTANYTTSLPNVNETAAFGSVGDEGYLGYFGLTQPGAGVAAFNDAVSIAEGPTTAFTAAFNALGLAATNSAKTAAQTDANALATANTLAVPVFTPTNNPEVFVDSYGTASNISGENNLLTVTGFHFGNPTSTTQTDTLVFAVSDWAVENATVTETATYAVNWTATWTESGTVSYNYTYGSQIFPVTTTPVVNAAFSESGSSNGTATAFASTTVAYHVDGLVQSDGNSAIAGGAFATYVQEGTAHTQLLLNADVILDSIAPNYANGAALQQALLTQAVGDLILYGSGVAAHSEVDILVAYNTPNGPNGGITIADVQLNNLAGTTALKDTSAFTASTLTVTDLVHIDTTGGLANFATHNIYFHV